MRLSTLTASVCLTVFAAGGVLGEEPAGSDSQKTSKGFGGLILLTPDEDWEEKWARPETPQFTTTDTVKFGGVVTVLVFFTNPATDKNGEIRILCDFRMTRPDGSVSTEVKGEVCADGPLEGDPNNVRLVEDLMGFKGEATDAPGVWTIEYRLTDVVRDASVDIKTSFTYVNDANTRT